MNPADALKALVNISFNPITDRTQRDLTVNGFGAIKGLTPIDPGTEITVEGYVTHVSSQIGTADKDVHFLLSSSPDQLDSFVVCEIQNATLDHKNSLDSARDNQSLVRAQGPLRIFLEHISATTPFTNHLFEVHPIRSASIDGQPLDNITMDSPDGADYLSNDSMYEMQLLSSTSVQFKKTSAPNFANPVDESVVANYDDPSGNILFSNIPQSYGRAGVEHNYVYVRGNFATPKGSVFNDGEPYSFLMHSTDVPAVAIKSYLIPNTPAYNDAKTFASNPPQAPVTAVAIRSLNIPLLLQSTYETVLCPVYRFDQGTNGN